MALADERVLDAAGTLGGDPLFLLSTAGQELFHSNMLAWLAKYHPEESEPVFQALGLASSLNGQLTASVVRREHRHIDLYFDPGMGAERLILENKVLAIPRRQQLDEYAARFADPHPKVFTLLTLIPAWAEHVPPPWTVVRYDDLVEPLRITASRLTGFDQALVERYASLVAGLIQVRDAVRPDSGLEPWLLDEATRSALRELRVLPLVEKMRCELLARQLKEVEGDLRLDINLTNSVGSVTYFHTPLASGHQLGWQVQGQQFRLAAVTGADKRLHGPSKQAKRLETVATAYRDYFDFAALNSNMLGADRSRKDWLGFNPNFVYQYRPIQTGATWDDLVSLCAAATRHADRFTGTISA